MAELMNIIKETVNLCHLVFSNIDLHELQEADIPIIEALATLQDASDYLSNPKQEKIKIKPAYTVSDFRLKQKGFRE